MSGGWKMTHLERNIPGKVGLPAQEGERMLLSWRRQGLARIATPCREDSASLHLLNGP